MTEKPEQIPRYDFPAVEKKWQARWEETGAHLTDVARPGRKYYCLVMFSYPSGDRLHVGHWYNYGPTDTFARFMRMRGFNVFEPQGFDAFGLPAENFAIKHGKHPKDFTDQNTAYMEKQLRAIGAMYDWTRKIDTSKPDYYKWTQWIFLKLHEKGLAYRKNAPVNWCPSCATVLANEQVEDGACERCGSEVTKRDLEQWFFKITDYADRLLEGHAKIEWPEKTITMQREWIGRSEGSEIEFGVEGHPDKSIRVFTTRADTLFGCTWMVLAPEHPLVTELTAKSRIADVAAYVEKSKKASEIERTSLEREKTGVPIGAMAVNPANGEKVPIWIADYVIATYGTGAVMAVPAHDERDYAFAKKYSLEVRRVIRPADPKTPYPEDAAFTDDGVMHASGAFDGLASAEGRKKVTTALAAKNAARSTVNYRLRDWLLSRQRYWGAPIPIVYCDTCGAVPVPEKDLPVELPYEIDLRNVEKGKSPLASVASFVNAPCPRCRKAGRREVDTMDTFVDSAWYFLRYMSSDRTDVAFDRKATDAWCPVDQYVGGVDHACKHLLYARFVTMALHDIGLIGFEEPFKRLFHQGNITKGGSKMSKSRGNVVNPDTFVEKYGADVFRMYLMYMGTYAGGGDWSDEGIAGIERFQLRLWRLLYATRESARKSRGQPGGAELKELRFRLHHTIRKVTEDTGTFSFNTAIARMFELLSDLEDYVRAKDENVDGGFLAEALDDFVRLVAPYAPHLAEELWELRGHEGKSVFDAGWPEFDPKALVRDEIEYVIQINGKVRTKETLPAGAAPKELESAALAHPRIVELLAGQKPRKVIVVPGRLVNIVV